MNRKTPLDRCLVCCLLLSAVLFLGIVQWSFLPLLVQGAPPPGRTLLEDSSCHTSKFAAPFKCLFGDYCLKPGLPAFSISSLSVNSPFFHLAEEPPANWQDVLVSDRQLRAPPVV